MENNIRTNIISDVNYDPSNDYIIESLPFIDEKAGIEEYNESMSTEQKLNNIVQRERKILAEQHNLNTNNLSGECVASTFRIVEYCIARGVKATHMWTTRLLKVGRGLGHHFSLIEISGKQYIIDCTYRQFFSINNEEFRNEDGYKLPGIYMLIDSKRAKVAQQILKNGWIEVTPESLKYYLDAFVMASKKCLDETEISYDEYMKMINNEKIEQTVRKCIDRLEIGTITESQIKSIIDDLTKMRDMKSVVVSLASFIKRLFGTKDQIINFQESMKDVLALLDGEYINFQEIMAEAQNNEFQSCFQSNNITRR